MHSSTFQTLLVLLPLLISTSVALPDNIFGKREARGHGAGSIPGAVSGASAPAGAPTGAPSGAPAGGWEALMSSFCGGSGGSATDAGQQTPATGTINAGATAAPTAKKMRRQAASPAVSGGAPAPTGAGAPSGGHGSGKQAHGAGSHSAPAAGAGAMCSGFSAFMAGASGTGAGAGAAPQATGVSSGSPAGNGTTT